MFGHENEARGSGALTTSMIFNLAKNSTTGVLEMDNDMNTTNKEVIDNISLNKDITKLESPN